MSDFDELNEEKFPLWFALILGATLGIAATAPAISLLLALTNYAS